MRLGKHAKCACTPQIAQAGSHPHTFKHSKYTPSQLAWCSTNIVRCPSHHICVYVRGPQLVVSGSQHAGKQHAAETMWGLQAPWFMHTGWLKSNRSPRSARKGGIITVRKKKKTLFASINLSTLRVLKVLRVAKSYQMSKAAKEANDSSSRFPLSGQTNNGNWVSNRE